MTIDYHGLGICTPEEGKALKEAGYRKTPQLADAYWHPEERTLYWVRAERESDVSLTCPSIQSAVYLKASIDNYYIRLPRLQELLEWIADQRRSVYPAFAVEMSIMDRWCGIDASGVAPSPAAAPHMLTAAVNMVLQLLRKPNAGTITISGSAAGGSVQGQTGAWGRDFTITPGVSPSFQQARSAAPPVQVPMRYEYRATETISLNFETKMERMTADGWEPIQLAVPTAANIFQVWRRWVPVEVKS